MIARKTYRVGATKREGTGKQDARTGRCQMLKKPYESQSSIARIENVTAFMLIVRIYDKYPQGEKNR